MTEAEVAVSERAPLAPATGAVDAVSGKPSPAPAIEIPPSRYEEDESAKGDAVLLFCMLDRDVSGYLDTKELEKAKDHILMAFAGSLDGKVIQNVLSSSDGNNDGKVSRTEWNELFRSMYEVIGRAKFKEGCSRWKSSLYDDLQIAAKKEQEKQNAKRKKKSVALTKDDAAAKIQARARGSIARKSTAKLKEERDKRAATKSKTDHDADVLTCCAKEARKVGRHHIKVVSENETHGNRAKFILDADEIEVLARDGDVGRGLKVVVLDPCKCSVQSRKCYDVVGTNNKGECKRLVEDLEAIQEGAYVMVACKGLGVKSLDQKAIAAMKCMGATYQGLGKEDVAYAFIGCKGKAVVAERCGSGRAEVEVSISLAKQEAVATSLAKAGQ
eukprot:TRINITY_DN24940_c1_g1_i1.p1 TRINITY_DN24940_c1_g1~~TRINITY_DN24940_c1_g1_i1.p1  ORF type:complete len:396 (+),score=67.45 TRINITY_DN24940_c1_g1_i1:31-1188(+)